MRITRPAALILAGTLCGPVLAEDKAVTAECGASGCTCSLGSITQEELATLYDLAPAPGPDSVLVFLNGEVEGWSQVSADQLDLTYGGDGTCELQIFAVPVPKDGRWQGTVTAEQIIGCPPAMEPALRTAVTGMTFQRDIRWGGSFHPDELRDPAAGPPAFVWTDRGGGAWTGAGKFNQPSSPLGLEMQATSRILAEDRIEAGLRITISMAAADDTTKAMLKAAGLTNCRVSARYGFTRVGD